MLTALLKKHRELFSNRREKRKRDSAPPAQKTVMKPEELSLKLGSPSPLLYPEPKTIDFSKEAPAFSWDYPAIQKPPANSPVSYTLWDELEQRMALEGRQFPQPSAEEERA